MILYDKKGDFLGMGQRELLTFGFQDFEEFKSHYNDPADMFINRAGYISKFKNFSWIDYALHSGVPSKNIIIKNTNGEELEGSLQISEIFLMQELNGSSGIYNIEINFSSEKNMQIHHSAFKEDDIDMHPHVSFEDEDESKVALNEEEPAPLEIPIYDAPKEAIKIEDFNNDLLEPPEEDVSINIDDNIELPDLDFDDTKTSDEPIKLTEEEYVPNIKLKIDLDSDFDKSEIFQEPKIEITTEKSENILEEKTFEEINIREKEFIKEDKPILAYDFDIDIVQIAEDTEMDLEDIALFIDAFIEESKQTIDLLETFDATTIKNMMIKLKGIASQLKIHSIIHTLDSIITSIGDDDFSDKIEIFKIQIEDMEERLS